MRGFFKLAFGISVMSLVAMSAPACGDDDDGGGSGGSGATGGTEGGTCDPATCESWKIGGLLDSVGCCPDDAPGKCGANVSKSVGGLIGFPEGCYQTKAGGAVDCGCPSKFFKSPLDGSDSVFNGCCAPSGECGLFVNLSAEGAQAADKKGPNLECVPLTKLGSPKVACTPGSETAPPPDPDGGEGNCPNPEAGTGGSGGSDGGGTGGTAGTDAGGDASTD